jgi:hypothetical protein
MELLKKIRSIGGTVLFVCSAFLTEFLFWNFSNLWYERVIWLMVGGVVETCKYFALMWVKHLLAKKAVWYQIVGYLFGYICACAISMLGSLAFALHSFQGQDVNATLQSTVVNSQVSGLGQIDAQITTALDEKNKVPTDYLKRQRELDATLKDLNAQKKDLLATTRQVTKNDVAVSTYQVFDQLGAKINKTGKETLFYIVIFMVVFIELFMATLTAAPIEKKRDVKEFKEVLNTYLEALFDIREGKVRLNNDEKISALTSLSSSEIRKCRQFILSQSYKGVPLLQGGRGAVKASYTKDATQKICNFILDTVAE